MSNSVFPSLDVTILSLFPEIFPGPLAYSLAGKALQQGIWQLTTYNIRDYALDKHQTVDDKPFGGGSGMVLRPDVLGRAIEATCPPPVPQMIYMSPRGEPLTQSLVRELSTHSRLFILCGRFEGVDERVLQHYKFREISCGDYVLSGGEIAALALLDACIRLLPHVIKTEETLHEESFGDDPVFRHLLEYPHYTRPVEWEGQEVPAVLRSGNHQLIKEWRMQQAEMITAARRPELWELYQRVGKQHK